MHHQNTTKFINILKLGWANQAKKTSTKKMETFQKIKEIANANKEGFTVSLFNFETPKKGYVVAMQLTQNSFGDKGLKKVIEVATQSTFLVGGWFNEENGRFYYDCVMICQNLQEAVKLGKANKQFAIFNLETEEVISI